LQTEAERTLFDVHVDCSSLSLWLIDSGYSWNRSEANMLFIEVIRRSCCCSSHGVASIDISTESISWGNIDSWFTLHRVVVIMDCRQRCWKASVVSKYSK